MKQEIKSKIFFVVVIIGFSALFTQIILLREFLVVYYGNELVIGLVLANWMLITGLGSLAGRFMKKSGTIHTIILLQVLLGMLPFITLFLVYYLRNVIYPTGVMINLFDIFYTSLLLLLPFCLISGFLFSYLSHYLSVFLRRNMVGKIYGLEALGSIAGGIVVSFIMIHFFNSFQSLLLVFAVNMVSAFYLSLSSKRWIAATVLLLSIFISLSYIYISPGEIAFERLYRGQHIIEQKDTPFGNVVVSQTGNQLNVVENGITIFSTDEVVINEESVHYAMLQHDNPENVLLISGGASGMIDEILKYPVKRIDYVELNKFILDVGKKYFGNPVDERVYVHNLDARLYIRKTDISYDVVLINLPDPSTIQINRYYTIDFLKHLKKVLNRDAVIATNLSSSFNYMSDEVRLLNSVLFKTLDSAFKNTMMIQGDQHYYIASNNNLEYGIVSLVNKKGINNQYVNGFYLNDDHIKMRSDYFKRSILPNVNVNKDNRPLAYLYQLKAWISYFNIDARVPLAIAILIFLLLILFQGPVNLGMLSTGFSIASFEFLLIIMFQTLYGYVYQQTGIIFTIFMSGMAVGSLIVAKRITVNQKQWFVRILLFFALISVVLPLIFSSLQSLNPSFSIFIHGIIYFISFLLSVFAGVEFALGARLKRGTTAEVAGGLYFIDLVGAAFGVLVVTTFILPLFGMTNTCFFIAGVNLLCAGYVFVRRRYIIG